MNKDKIQKTFDLLQLGSEQERQGMLNQGIIENNKEKDEHNFEILFLQSTNDICQETSEKGD